PMRSMSLFLLAASCAAFVGACTPPGAAANKSTAPRGAATCDAASLSLAPTTVVGSLDGKPVTFADLGPELQKAEERAHRDYCDTLYANRRMALDNYVAEKLVGAAATKAGVTEEE